jgi:hypothetical protein
MRVDVAVTPNVAVSADLPELKAQCNRRIRFGAGCNS